LSKNKRKTNNPDYKLASDQFYNLNKEFYDGFLSNFYSMKVVNLLAIITNADGVVDHLKESNIELNKLTIPTDQHINPENMLKYAKTELAMSYFHCCETFIRLFIAHAKLSACPWLEIPRLTISKYKGELEKLSKGEFNHLNTYLDEDETLLFVFTGRTKPGGIITDEFISGYKEYVTYAANELLETFDYNSYKHGLSIMPSEDGFQFGDRDSEFHIEEYGEVLKHLTRVSSDNRMKWAKQTNFIQYDQRATFIIVLEELMSSMLKAGRIEFLDEEGEIRVFKAHEFSPSLILNSDNDDGFRVSNHKVTLQYHE